MAWENRNTVNLMRQGDVWVAVQAIMDLPASCILDLSDEPTPEREIAAALGISHQAVGHTFSRAMRKLSHPSRLMVLEEMDG